jgi:hypothetical protein
VIEQLLEAERALSFGLIDKAEALYRRVAAADPHDAIAVVGLARVAIERGDDLGAYLLARRALSIDPENDAARRLATRLEEVLATRGEPVDDPMPPGSRSLSGAPKSPVGPADPPGPQGPGASSTEASATEASAAEATPAPPPPTSRRSLLDRFRRG